MQSEKTPFSEALSAYTTVSTITQKIPFPKLQILDLSENDIRGTDFLKLLPNSLYFLDLHNNGLEFFDLNIADKLIVLNLNNNNFHCTKNLQFQVEPCLSVVGLKDLHYFSVSTNNITSIESTTFQDNNKLVHLNLSVNNIKTLHRNTFANLQYLKVLDLSQNELENVPNISNKIGITSLYINNNYITKLMSNAFAQMPKLMDLWLGENQINEIDVEAFANLSVLWELDLSRNKLSFLPEGWTKSLVSLRVMDLSDNQFTSIESLSLTNAPRSLVEVFLRRTPLKYLNVRYIESLPQDLVINFTNMSKFTINLSEIYKEK
ncbi:uncharacterized protein LOC143900375 isoform X2 [Temnothorax americanus]|uniref:uncharacterized protein LOC143900375 isoform X2 n=1 Tax=Temnothorax americanus TaxID=1964332 RepID=UPI004068ED12